VTGFRNKSLTAIQQEEDKCFALLECSAAQIGSYRRFGENYRPFFEGQEVQEECFFREKMILLGLLNLWR